MHRSSCFSIDWKTASSWLLSGCLLGLVMIAAPAQAEEAYEIHPDSQVQEGVPQGEILGPFTWKSEIFPGTVRDYWLYVPAQYDKEEPACVMVVQDGLKRSKGWNLTTVMDNLIHQKAMPVTIGIFINPGEVPSVNPKGKPRSNRSFEYDSLGDQYARFLLEEIMPEVSKKYHLSDDPNDRAIAGASSGAICAFNVAWERPDEFRRVLSTIGTFVNIRGGHSFPTMIRKHETKPIRVFLQDGSTDLNLYSGSWWQANQQMLAALEWAGYEVNHSWGEGGHSSKHAAAIMPEVMRWLWEGYPEPIKTPQAPERRTDVLIPGEEWQEVSSGHQFTEGPAVNAQGEVFFVDVPAAKIFKIGLDDKVTLFTDDSGHASGLMFGGDGRLYGCCNRTRQIVAFDPDGHKEVLAEGVRCNDLALGKHGIYFTSPSNKTIYLLRPGQKPEAVDEGIEKTNGLVFSPDLSHLYVADTDGQFVYAFQVQADGTLANRQALIPLELRFGQTKSSADGMTFDQQGRLYVTSDYGLQVCTTSGSVHFIITKPQDDWLANVVIGGENFDTLYVTTMDKVFKRKIKAEGVRPRVQWQTTGKDQ
ncbi:Enterochelin esterase/Sugar lactone lactonase YvrE [Planctomycetales bacterium 10988]|nr:Enterochelin esterase/Sugar lactone lactonase YvrE [Planctomycetales bacterium 10988]